MMNYPSPNSTFGAKYDQISNVRRVLICISNRYHLSKEFLKCGEKEFMAYFDTLESCGLIVLHDPSRRHQSEGYLITPDKILEVEELSKQRWRRALKELSLFALAVTITAAVNR